jgi:hypothetical protein
MSLHRYPSRTKQLLKAVTWSCARGSRIVRNQPDFSGDLATMALVAQEGTH